ncbi:MAG: GNAT family N-acetyltransferase [Myxococcota bacterium]
MPPELLTPRLKLWMPPPERAEEVVAYFERNRSHLEPWEPARPSGFYSRRFWEARLAANIQEQASSQSMRLFLELRGSGRLVGSCNFSNVMRGAFQACHLGYAIGAAEQGRGFMHEALSGALPFAFEQLALHRIMANYQPVNERSGRLLRRLGFVVEGYARDYLYIDGAWRDHVLTSLTRPL